MRPIGFVSVLEKSALGRVVGEVAANNEVDLIENEGMRSGLPHAYWEFELDLGPSPEETWGKIAHVVRAVVSQDASSWPDDDAWRAVLPEWLTSFLLSPEECDELIARTPREQWASLPWEFGSWLDAMRERDWKWWGAARDENKLRIVLELTGIPPRVAAFKQILIASSAEIVSENRRD